jgi:hypothetical protein
VKDRDVAAPSPRIAKRPDVLLHVVVDRQRVDVALVAHRAQQIAHAARRIADGVAAMRCRQPLIDVIAREPVNPPRSSRSPTLRGANPCTWNQSLRQPLKLAA